MNLKKALIGGVAALALAGPALAEDWPDLPVGIKNGIGARIGDRLVVGLGSAGTEVYGLDLTEREAGWKPLSPFIGPAPSGAAAAVSSGRLYVFSGSGLPTPDAASPVVFDTVHRYDPEADKWERLDTTAPVGLLGASALPLPDGRIALVGGYNKELFDRYLAESSAIDKEAEPELWAKTVSAYMGMQPADYRWNATVLSYDPAANAWGDLGPNPDLPNTGSGVVEAAPGEFLIVNGEVKPGLRTDAVKRVTFTGGAATWTKAPGIPAPKGATVQEGLAGAFAGMIDGKPVVAGGANFPGAKANAEAGRWYAHEGLTKTWNAEVYMLDGDAWTQAGALAEGLAYGAAFTVDDALVVVGGEDSAGKARPEVFALTWEDGTLVRHD